MNDITNNCKFSSTQTTDEYTKTMANSSQNKMNKLVLMGEKQNRSRIVFLGVTLGHVKLTVLKCCTGRLA